VHQATPRALVDAIEAQIHQDVGRRIGPLFAASKGGLWGAVAALAAAPSPHVGLLTGFYVPLATPPAAETDGPAAAALLALGFTRVGLSCRLLTDDPCRSACRVALRAAGLDEVPIDSVAVDAPLDAATARWRSAGIDWAIAVERCGRSAGGPPRNMRGEDISRYAAPLDDVFAAGPWRTIAIGDGGNEIGMGALPRRVIAAAVDYGELIACATPADHLITAGVSHWGAYALLAGLAVLRPDWRATLLDCLDPAMERRILEAVVREGPAVDGVTLRQAPTVDSLDCATHSRKAEAIRLIAQAAATREANSAGQ
jgi:hypothetical protein